MARVKLKRIETSICSIINIKLSTPIFGLPMILVYKRINRLTTSYINDLLIRNCDVHNRNTRYSKLNLNCPRYKRESEGGRTFTVKTIRLGTVLLVT